MTERPSSSRGRRPLLWIGGGALVFLLACALGGELLGGLVVLGLVGWLCFGVATLVGHARWARLHTRGATGAVSGAFFAVMSVAAVLSPQPPTAEQAQAPPSPRPITATSSAVPTPTMSTSRSQTSIPTTPAATTASPPPTVATSVTTRTPPAPSPASRLVGYGALREDWDSHHQQAPGYTAGAAYLPMVDGDQPRYGAVSGDPGERILIYTVNFANGTTLNEAKREVLQEFPPGARFGRQDAQEAGCLILEVRSNPVEKVLEGYRPIVAFFTDSELGDQLRKDHVDDASLLIASADEGNDLGSC